MIAGRLFASGGRFDITGSITSAPSLRGTLTADSRLATPQLGQMVNSGQTAVFTQNTGRLAIEQPANFTATIAGFTSGNVVHAVGAAGATFDTATDQLTLPQGTTRSASFSSPVNTVPAVLRSPWTV